MAREEDSHKCSTRSSSSSVSVKGATKQKKKVPQRGLGVAQLEKIRLEEQNKKIPSNSTNSSSSCLPLQCTPNFRPNINNISDDVLSPSSPVDLPLLKPPISSQIDVDRPKNNGNWWSGDRPEGENVGIRLPYVTNSDTPNWPVTQRSPFSSSSMVRTSSSAIEPPSNQSYCGTNNNYTTLMWPPDDKMAAGMKRPYPFYVENAEDNCFPRLSPPPAYSSHISRYEELPSCSYGFTLPKIEPPIPVFRDMPSISSGVEHNPRRITKDNAGLSGDFLTLAPPIIPLQNWRPNHFSPSDIPEFEYLPYQEGGQYLVPVPRPVPGSVVSIQQPYISFLPSMASSGSGSSRYGEIRESVDLNLKL